MCTIVHTIGLYRERSWKNVKILKYATRFANELRSVITENPTIEDILAANVMQREVNTTRVYWVPSPERKSYIGKLNAHELEKGLAKCQKIGMERGRKD